MSYENPELPEGINVGRESPLLEFLRLAAGLALVVVAVSAVLYFAGGWLARQIPFSTERAWVADNRVPGIDIERPGPADRTQIEPYLQALSTRLAIVMQVPGDMALQLHYVDQDVPNAYASLGGHIAVTSGLYQHLHSENALALVLGHEIAHIRARDPIAGLGGSASMLLVLSLLTGDASSLSGAFASVVQRGYSRAAEAEADRHAINALRALYGHAGGAEEVFETFARYRQSSVVDVPWLLATHPLDVDRIARLRQASLDWDAQRQPLVPLPFAGTP